MTCKRCKCTETTPCPGGCAWMLPDLCTSCLTPEEAAIGRQLTGVVDSLRAELLPNRAERFLLAVAQGLAANPDPEGRLLADVRLFAQQAAEMTEALIAVAGTLDIDPPYEPDEEAPRISAP